MTTFLTNQYRKDIFANQSNCNRKKIKHFSYTGDDKIGKGYSSVVYRGTNDLNNETIAIKAIDMKGVRDAVSREMLDCQIEALTKLKHPNILKCYDVVREISHCYIITEFCDEGDLSSFLKKKKRISEQEVLKIMKDIVSGFIEIGDKNYLHRDLKLANIFISNGRAIIADFGFAKKNSFSAQKQKYNVGSPLYMSPEALKKNIYSIKNDIWSIGIMLFELLHGETPWECKTEKQLIDKMVRVPVRFRESLNLSDGIKSFIKKCLEVNEDQRMSLQDLKQWNNQNSYESLARQGIMYFDKLELGKKSISTKQETKVLSQVTNRVPSRSQSNLAYQSKSIKDISLQKQNTSLTNKENKDGKQNKENRFDSKTMQLITKPVIEKNNNILIREINTFRLLFKIYERLNKYYFDEKQLINTIGNDVLSRVNSLMNTVCPPNDHIVSINSYGLTDVANYISQNVNSSIKKYKSVIKEYHKKYTTQISIHALGRQISTKNLMKEGLLKGKLMKQQINSDEMVMIYWMLEFISLSKDMKKEELDAVIDPKSINISKGYLADRIAKL